MFDARQGWALSMDDQATISGIVRTTDGGRTWSKHGGFKGLQSVSFASIRSGVAQDSNSCSLQLSTQDGGQSWSSYHYSITA